jgi:hypothetical protein
MTPLPDVFAVCCFAAIAGSPPGAPPMAGDSTGANYLRLTCCLAIACRAATKAASLPSKSTEIFRVGPCVPSAPRSDTHMMACLPPRSGAMVMVNVDVGMGCLMVDGPTKREVVVSVVVQAFRNRHKCQIFQALSKWKTRRHIEQVEQRLQDYVYPVIGHLPIADIKLAEIKQVLEPIWQTKNPTANRIRMHLEFIINWAIAERHRSDESNPAEIR